MNFINKEIDRINEILGKNENINVLYSKENTVCNEIYRSEKLGSRAKNFEG